MKPEQSERERFEAWAKRFLAIGLDIQGDYRNFSTAAAWEAWQAALAAPAPDMQPLPVQRQTPTGNAGLLVAGDGAAPDAATVDQIVTRITAYLSGGGLFNPELANHDAVRDLLIDCRAAVERVIAEQERLREIARDAADAATTLQVKVLEWRRAHNDSEEARERAEAERDALKGLLAAVRDDWMRSPDPSGTYWVARIDAALNP